MTDSSPRPGGGKKAWQPSNQAKQLLAATASKLIVLPKGERQWVLQQLRVFDTSRSAAPKAKKKPKSKKPASKKSGWKSEWHKSPAYQEWQAKVVPEARKPKIDSAEGQEFLRLRQEAFRIRDALKAKWKGKDSAPKTASASAEQNPSGQASRAEAAGEEGEHKHTIPEQEGKTQVDNEVVSQGNPLPQRSRRQKQTFKLKSQNENRTRKKGSIKNPAIGPKLVINEQQPVDQVGEPAAEAADEGQMEGTSKAGEGESGPKDSDKP
jgi:hypothetical protein